MFHRGPLGAVRHFHLNLCQEGLRERTRPCSRQDPRPQSDTSADGDRSDPNASANGAPGLARDPRGLTSQGAESALHSAMDPGHGPDLSPLEHVFSCLCQGACARMPCGVGPFERLGWLCLSRRPSYLQPPPSSLGVEVRPF